MEQHSKKHDALRKKTRHIFFSHTNHSSQYVCTSHSIILGHICYSYYNSFNDFIVPNFIAILVMLQWFEKFWWFYSKSSNSITFSDFVHRLSGDFMSISAILLYWSSFDYSITILFMFVPTFIAILVILCQFL